MALRAPCNGIQIQDDKQTNIHKPFCGRCSGWGHIAPHCKATDPKCSICAKDYTTAPSRGAERGRAAHAHMGRPSVLTVEDLTGRGRMPAWLRGRPALSLGDGGHRPPHAGSRGPAGPSQPRHLPLPRARPRPPNERGRATRRSRWCPNPSRRRWGNRGEGIGQSGFSFFFSFVLSFCRAV